MKSSWNGFKIVMQQLAASLNIYFLGNQGSKKDKAYCYQEYSKQGCSKEPDDFFGCSPQVTHNFRSQSFFA